MSALHTYMRTFTNVNEDMEPNLKCIVKSIVIALKMRIILLRRRFVCMKGVSHDCLSIDLSNTIMDAGISAHRL